LFEQGKAIVEAQKQECLLLDPLLEAHSCGLSDIGLSTLFFF
jgi:hypothetical protein